LAKERGEPAMPFEQEQHHDTMAAG